MEGDGGGEIFLIVIVVLLGIAVTIFLIQDYTRKDDEDEDGDYR